MSYLLDANALSETVRRDPDRSVIAWLEAVPSEALHVSVLTLGEIRRGVEKLAVADRWSRLLAEVGHPVPTIDSLLAASALHHELRVVTRNARDFRCPGLEVVDPWRVG